MAWQLTASVRLFVRIASCPGTLLAGRWSLRASQYSSKYIRGSLQINVNVDVGVNTCMVAR